MKKRRTESGKLINVRVRPFENRYEATGRWDAEAKRYDVNYSSILTRLIHDTGRFSVCYASDLFVEWEHFIKTLLSWEETEDSTYIFGIREMGVDNEEPVIKALKNGKYDRYRAIWGIRVKKEGCDIWLKMEMLDFVEEAGD